MGRRSLKYLILSFSLIAAIALACCTSAIAQFPTIKDLAQYIALQHNANANKYLDDVTVSSHAIAVGRNVRFENVLRVEKNLSPTTLEELSDELQDEIVPQLCLDNANTPEFYRGLYYTFVYKNTFGEKLFEFFVNKEACGF